MKRSTRTLMMMSAMSAIAAQAQVPPPEVSHNVVTDRRFNHMRPSIDG